MREEYATSVRLVSVLFFFHRPALPRCMARCEHLDDYSVPVMTRVACPMMADPLCEQNTVFSLPVPVKERWPPGPLREWGYNTWFARSCQWINQHFPDTYITTREQWDVPQRRNPLFPGRGLLENVWVHPFAGASTFSVSVERGSRMRGAVTCRGCLERGAGLFGHRVVLV